MPTPISVYPIAETDAELKASKDALAASEAANQAYAGKVASLTTQNQQLTTDLSAANAEITRLNAIIAGGQPPVPPKPKTLVGSSTGGANAPGDFEAYATRCGGLESIRAFSPPGKMPTSLSATTAASSVGKRHIALSFKGRDPNGNIDVSNQSLVDGKDDAWLSALMDSKPADQALSLIWRHEPDEENPNVTLWKAAQVKFRALVDAANKRAATKYGTGNFKPIQFGANLMSWSAQKVPARIKDFYPGPKIWDFISWDGYTKKGETGAQTFAACVEWNNTVGKGEPFAIGETGMDGTTATDRSAFIKSVMDFAKANNAPWAHYWNASTADGNYVLSPADEKVLGQQS